MSSTIYETVKAASRSLSASMTDLINILEAFVSTKPSARYDTLTGKICVYAIGSDNLVMQSTRSWTKGNGVRLLKPFEPPSSRRRDCGFAIANLGYALPAPGPASASASATSSMDSRGTSVSSLKLELDLALVILLDLEGQGEEERMREKER